MFKELFTEGALAKRRKGSGKGRSTPTPSKPRKINDIVKDIKNMSNEDLRTIYDELDRGYMSEDVYELTIVPGEYNEYYDDRDKPSILKKAKSQLEKAMKKIGFEYEIQSCRNSYLKSFVKEESEYIQGKFPNKKVGIYDFNDWRVREDFDKKYDVTVGLKRVLEKVLPAEVCDFKSSGITKIDIKNKKSEEYISVRGRTSSWTFEYEITVYVFNSNKKYQYIVSRTETSRL